jgi:D-alanine-D-alanine ligase
MIDVAVVMGGYSDESKISIKSGQLIYDNLDRSKYNPYKVQILNTGWNCIIGNSYTINGTKNKFDIIFNTIHGTPGEDGYLQSYFEILEIPFTGCAFYQAALTFNKKDCIAVLNKYGILSAKSIYLNIKDKENINFTKTAELVGLPFIVKPNQSGSSLGISKVNKLADFEPAIKKAFHEDSDILIENFLNGTEVSVGVLNYNNQTKVLGLTEIVTDNDFFDYEAKYEGKSKEITPARVSKEIEDKIKRLSKNIYECLGMSGFSRTDFIIVDNEPHFIEMNTLPGLSPQSIFPQQAKHAGISLKELFTNEIELALKRISKWNV